MKSQGWLGCLLLLGGLLGPVRAQEVLWRSDYAQARREAELKNRPLLLAFVAPGESASDLFEGAALREGRVARMLNEQFVALRLERDAQPALIKALHVQKVPTLVLAASNGRVLGIKDTPLDADALLAFLATAHGPKPADSVPTAPVAEAHQKAVDEARTALDDADTARAVRLLQQVVKDTRSSPAQAKAAEMLKTVEAQATERLQQGLKLQGEGKLAEAYQALNDVTKLYPGTQAADEAGPAAAGLLGQLDQRTQERAKRAKDILIQAREDFRSEQYLTCLDRCEVLANDYADLPEATEANQMLTVMKANPAWLQKVCDAIPQRYGMVYLTMAEAQLKQGQPQQAVYYLELILQAFPNSRAAELARIRLAQIQGGPAMPGM